jgi:small subunit ribosomal protein S3Ae
VGYEILLISIGGVLLAAKKASSRAAARKIKDKWRAKNWYRVLAPDMFEGVQIGETLADNPEKLKGRVMDVTLQQLTGDFSKMHIKLHFKINSISGSDAHSSFIGHSLTSDYIRRLTRRKRSKMDGIYDVVSKDGFTVRVKPFAVTEKRIQTSQQYSIRMKMKSLIEKHASEKLVSEFIREMLSGDLSSRIFKECKPIYPIKRVEIRRSQIISIPDRGPEMILPKSVEAIEADQAAEDTDTVAKPEEVEIEPTGKPQAPVAEAASAEPEQPKADQAPEVETAAESKSEAPSKTEKKPKKSTKKSTTKKSTTKKSSTKTKKTTKKKEE